MSQVFQVGDVCQFKDYDELVAEFGEQVSESGRRYIKNLYFGWDPAMKEMCGKVFTVSKVEKIYAGPKYFSEERVEYCRDGGSSPWAVGHDMLKLYEGSLPEINEDEFMEVLFSMEANEP